MVTLIYMDYIDNLWLHYCLHRLGDYSQTFQCGSHRSYFGPEWPNILLGYTVGVTVTGYIPLNRVHYWCPHLLGESLKSICFDALSLI